MERITLTPEEVAEIREAQELAKMLSRELNRAKSAGLDVADIEESFNDLNQKLMGIVRVYLSGRK